jgi:glycosyltransferase involved in cell wall biosynthesis
MWPLTLIELADMSKYHPFIILLQIAENSAYRHSDTVVSLMPFAKEYMAEHGMAPGKFVHIPNGVVLDDWNHAKPLPTEHERALGALKNSGEFIVGYFGGHALSNALETLIACAEKIADGDVHFVLVGDGIEKAGLMRQAESKGLKNITFLPPIEKLAIPTLCAYFDCIYIGAKASPLYRFGLAMNKMFDAMMSGKPVVCAITTPASPITEYDCGIALNSMDIDGIIGAIETLKHTDNSVLEQLRTRSQKAVRNHYEYGHLARLFEAAFYRIENQQ